METMSQLKYSLEHIDELTAIYRDGLLGDVLPFWLNHCIDRKHGGFMMSLDQDGTVIDTDKGAGNRDVSLGF